MKTRLITVVIATLLSTTCLSSSAEPTKATQSVYEKNILKATTSKNLTKADLAWHALNTYGWDCEEVISRDKPNKDGYFVITCGSGTKLRVYPREKKHPKITNTEGTYKRTR